MNAQETEKLPEALRQIDSLISKSEKALEKLLPKTWQHAMIRNHIKALRIASALMKKDIQEIEKMAQEDLTEAMHALSDMVSRTAQSHSQFLPGTSQHTLQRNRLMALHLAKELTKLELDSRHA